jgi:glycosyltransferase involved in cell wall biosynthesis
MDILILHGMYNQTVRYLDEYRNLRKDGKVYCGLDMQNYWMGNISWDSPNAITFAQQCDVIATSGRSMRDMLNGNPKAHFPCRWLPNGFLNPTGVKIIADPEIKENTILTVGRIGSSEKNNAELLIAFARVSEELSGWSLRLAGAIEPEFQSYIEHYFSKRPDLKERVVFTGAITDKKELYGEYSRAKVFALTSPLEGGTPNVFAEALFHGCMFVTSNIDASDDITNYGQLGAVYTLGDLDALCDTLVKVCSGTNKKAFRKHIPKALDYAMRYYDWNRNVKKLAYMLFFKDWNPI